MELGLTLIGNSLLILERKRGIHGTSILIQYISFFMYDMHDIVINLGVFINFFYVPGVKSGRKIRGDISNIIYHMP